MIALRNFVFQLGFILLFSSCGLLQIPLNTVEDNCAPLLAGELLSAEVEKLQDTCLYQDAESLKPSAIVFNYRPQYELWSDGAQKNRWIYLPPGQKINSAEMGAWVMPVGTRIWKEFLRDGKKVETRMITKVSAAAGPASWNFATYAWSADQKEAVLLKTGATNVLGTAHDIPSPAVCMSCHQGSQDGALGFNALQLSKEQGEDHIDLMKLKQYGLLSDNPAGNFRIPGSAKTQAALGYLQANCSHCHFSGGSAFAFVQMDLRHNLDAPSMQQQLAYRTLMTTGKIIEGDPDASRIVARMSARPGGMPSLGTETADTEGLRAIREWILEFRQPDPGAGHISMSDNLSCGIRNAQLKCWGGSVPGDGSASTLAPVTVTGMNEKVSQVSVGSDNACTIKNGGVYCWGHNESGQLGNGSFGNSVVTRPALISSLSSGVTQIAVGPGQSCAIQNGALKCWGDNFFGLLGVGISTNPVPSPTTVIGLESGVTAVSIGYEHICAIQNSALKCWGQGNLGLGVANDIREAPTTVVASGATFVAVGYLQNCVVVNGGARCWGFNSKGETGILTNNLSPVLVPTLVPGATSGVKSIAIDQNQACAVVNGGVMCWGSGSYGRLGDGTALTDAEAVAQGRAIRGPAYVVGIPSGSGAVGIETSYRHVCAKLDNEKIKCWGVNGNFGSLGTGEVSPLFTGTPVEVHE
jgi:hypothetical protein